MLKDVFATRPQVKSLNFACQKFKYLHHPKALVFQFFLWIPEY